MDGTMRGAQSGRTPTLYELLRVARTADERTISVAYRQLARRYHPDVDPRPEALRRMMTLNKAYAVLRDPERRAAYDRSLRRGSADDWEGDTGPVVVPPAPHGPDDPHVVTLPFGRYEGWPLDRVARVDRPYLEWLERMPVARGYRDAIAAALARSRGRDRVTIGS